MNGRIGAVTCWAIALMVSFTATAFGQSTSGSINGTVKDSSGGSVPGASVTIANPAHAVMQKTATNEEGIFVLPELEPGNYTIWVEKAGFKKLEKSGVILSTSTKLNLGDFVLQVGGVAETVTVQAEAGRLQIQSESGERSDLITNKQIKNLALNGRNILDLTKMIPGIINTNQNAQSTVTNAGAFNVNGTRSNMHEITVDGATNINTGNNSGLLVTVNPDAVGEVKVLTSNYQAEYGRAGGGFVQVTTKSGTNEYHATARYFRRHDSLNADSFFNNANGRPVNIYRYNFYGYDAGGPVPLPGTKGNRKLFFFFSEEYYRQQIPEGARTIRVPTQAERAGDFSQTVDGAGARIFIKDPLLPGNCNAADQTACFRDAGVVNKIPQGRFYSNGQAILNLYPLPNVSGRNDFNYSSQVSSKYPRHEDILRMDYQISDNTRLSGRFIRNTDDQLFAYGTTSASWNWPLTFASRANGPGYALGFTLTHNFSPTLINEFNYAPSLGAVTIAMVDDKGTRKTNSIAVPLLFSDANPGDAVPNFTYGGIAGIVNNSTNTTGFPNTGFNGSPFTQTFRIDNLMDNLTKVAGRHVVKTGFYFERSHNRRTSFGPIQANINFNSDANNPLNTGHPFANALLGIYNTYEQASVQLRNDFVYDNVEGYLQDTWKLTPRLTLDYGLRLSYYQPLYDQEGQLSLFNSALFDRSKAVRSYFPVCVNNAGPCSANNRRAADPALLGPGFVPTAANTQPAAFVGLIVPGSGDLANGIGQASKGYPRGGFNSATVLLGPRLGFAYDLSGQGKTVVRGGFGMTYDRIRGDVTIDAITNPPNVQQPTLFYGRLDDIPSLRGTGGVLAIPTVVGLDQGGELPTVYTYSLSVQRNLGWSTAVDVAYVGTLSRHLPRIRNLNALPYGTTFTRAAQDPTAYSGALVPAVQPGLPLAYSQAGLSFTGQNALPVNFLRPYPGYGDIGYRSFDATANYNALQVSLNRRFSRGLTFGVAYTWSKTLTTANDETGTYTHPFNPRGYDYQVANFDRTHVLVVNYVYDLPKVGHHFGNHLLARAIFDNWQLSGISQFVTGTPLELGLSISGVDAGQRLVGAYSAGNLSAQQPRFYFKSNPSAGPNGLAIDPNAFVAPAIGNLGPYPRTYLRNPGWNNHDLSVFKNFPLGREGSRYLQMRFEFFNVFNHAEFSGINNGTNLVVPNGADASGNPVFISGAAIFNNNSAGTGSSYNNVIISNNVRGQRASDVTGPLGKFFGEFSGTRDPRIIQLAVKLYF